MSVGGAEVEVVACVEGQSTGSIVPAAACSVERVGIRRGKWWRLCEGIGKFEHSQIARVTDPQIATRIDCNPAWSCERREGGSAAMTGRTDDGAGLISSYRILV